jgi:signal peptide peptidase SppA
VFDVDSPGGTVTGVPELAAEIFAARGKKPIVAVANGMAASAAIWLATAADQVVCIPSGEVGSIGVYCAHQDVSAAMEKAGVSITFIKAGKFKTEGNPYEPANAEYFAYQQKGVDDTYQDFLAAVAKGRGVSVEKVEADFGQGRMLSAKDALAAGLIDRIATLDEVVSELLGAEASVEPSVLIVQPADSGVEVVAEVVASTVDEECPCDCPECEDGDCEDCTGEDGDCMWDGEDYALVAKGVAFADLTPEDIEAEKLTGKPIMRYSKVYGPNAKGVTLTKSVTKEQFDALSKAAPVVAEEIAPEPLSAEAVAEAVELIDAAKALVSARETEANLNAAYKAKVMRMFS